MYDKSDPRSKLSTARSDPNSGSTATPASYGLYYKDDPVDADANGRAGTPGARTCSSTISRPSRARPSRARASSTNI
ncbi:MAG: hypothetical protein WDN24_17990 [Sphingomonas sp.]